MSLSIANVDALWLHPGSAIMDIALKNGLVRANGGSGQGYYQTYQNSEHQCLIVIFSGGQTTHFEGQVPHNMKRLGQHVYQNHNNRQIIVFDNRNNPVAVKDSGVSTTSDPSDFHCMLAFRYCHLSKPEETLRLGCHGIFAEFLSAEESRQATGF